MRKLLLTSSALVAAASISSYAVADVSVTGGFEWKYTQQAADQTSKDGDSFHTDNEVVIKFTNKTDSGLTLTGVYDIDADAGTLHFYKNGVVQNSGTAAFTGLTSGPYFFGGGESGQQSGSWNFGQQPFTHTPPAGYKSLNTNNI